MPALKFTTLIFHKVVIKEHEVVIKDFTSFFTKLTKLLLKVPKSLSIVKCLFKDHNFCWFHKFSVLHENWLLKYNIYVCNTTRFLVHEICLLFHSVYEFLTDSCTKFFSWTNPSIMKFTWNHFHGQFHGRFTYSCIFHGEIPSSDIRIHCDTKVLHRFIVIYQINMKYLKKITYTA